MNRPYRIHIANRGNLEVVVHGFQSILFARSAFYGAEDHNSQNEHIEAGEVKQETVHEEHIKKDRSFTIPVGEFFKLLSRLTPREEVEKMVYADCIEDGDTEEEAKAKAEKKGNEFEKQMEEKAKEVAETADYIDNVESELVREVGQDALKKISEKKPLSAENKRKLSTALSNASRKLKKAQIAVNLKSKGSNLLEEPALEAQNTEFNKKINEYDNFRALLQDGDVSDVKKGVWVITEAFGNMMNEAAGLNFHDYMKHMESQFPSGMSNSMFRHQAEEAYFVLNAINAVGKGLGKGIAALDSATGKIGSQALDKLGEFWDSLHIPSFVEQKMRDWGFSKRTALNAADLSDYAARSVASWGVGKCAGAMLSNLKKGIFNQTGAKRTSKATYNRYDSLNKGVTGRRNKGFQMESPEGKPQNKNQYIGGREYSGHALDQMQNRGIFPFVVENAIKTGKKTISTSSELGSCYVFTDVVNRVRVIVSQSTGRVVTVTFGGE